VSRPGDARLLSLVRRLAERFVADGRMLATAESCTGGLIAKCVTDLPGSSTWFERGWVTYTDRAKRQELDVAAGLLKRHGAVSEPVARAMARGVLKHSRADVAVAVTGIAGPDGGTPEKPVGTVWIAWAWRNGTEPRVVSWRYLFEGDRDAVRRQTAATALKGLLEG
jgi:nicotinamide-nucleotide amidase